jgi:hypothetical protein
MVPESRYCGGKRLSEPSAASVIGQKKRNTSVPPKKTKSLLTPFKTFKLFSIRDLAAENAQTSRL